MSYTPEIPGDAMRQSHQAYERRIESVIRDLIYYLVNEPSTIDNALSGTVYLLPEGNFSTRLEGYDLNNAMFHATISRRIAGELDSDIYHTNYLFDFSYLEGMPTGTPHLRPYFNEKDLLSYYDRPLIQIPSRRFLSIVEDELELGFFGRFRESIKRADEDDYFRHRRLDYPIRPVHIIHCHEPQQRLTEGEIDFAAVTERWIDGLLSNSFSDEEQSRLHFHYRHVGYPPFIYRPKFAQPPILSSYNGWTSPSAAEALHAYGVHNQLIKANDHVVIFYYANGNIHNQDIIERTHTFFDPVIRRSHSLFYIDVNTEGSDLYHYFGGYSDQNVRAEVLPSTGSQVAMLQDLFR